MFGLQISLATTWRQKWLRSTMENGKIHRGLEGIHKTGTAFKSAIVITKEENGKLTSWWAGTYL